MTEPIIRFVEEKDLDELVELCALHAIFERSEFDPKNKKQDLRKHLFSDKPSFKCLVVEHSNKIIGYSSYMKQYSTWDADFYLFMDCLFLSEGSRGFGIGEKIMDIIKEEAIKENCFEVQWQTPNFNTRAIKFYKRIGGKLLSKERFFIEL